MASKSEEVKKETGDASLPPFPDSFLRFMEENGIAPEVFRTTRDMRRFVRLNRRKLSGGNMQAAVRKLEEELGTSLCEVPWLPPSLCVYSLSGEVQIGSSRASKNGEMAGVDAASVAAVAALQVQPGHSVLDLCCAPGAKLCLLSELVGDGGLVVGVDVSAPRLNTCRTLVRRAGCNNVRLFQADGTQFDPLAAATEVLKAATEKGGFRERKRRRKTESQQQQQSTTQTERERPTADTEPETGTKREARAPDGGPSTTSSICSSPSNDESKGGEEEEGAGGSSSSAAAADPKKNLLKLPPHLRHPVPPLFDRVLVDAECTHDGSVRHIHKFGEEGGWGWESFDRRVMDPHRLESLGTLQRGLLSRGLSLLKPGGLLVYSTCSLASAQNEKVVCDVLSKTLQGESGSASSSSSSSSSSTGHSFDERGKECHPGVRDQPQPHKGGAGKERGHFSAKVFPVRLPFVLEGFESPPAEKRDRSHGVTSPSMEVSSSRNHTAETTSESFGGSVWSVPACPPRFVPSSSDGRVSSEILGASDDKGVGETGFVAGDRGEEGSKESVEGISVSRANEATEPRSGDEESMEGASLVSRFSACRFDPLHSGTGGLFIALLSVRLHACSG